MSENSPTITYPSVHLGKAIHKIIRERKMSNLEFCQGAGISRGYLPKLLKKPNIGPERLQAISKFLKIDLCLLLISDGSQEIMRKGQALAEVEASLAEARQELADREAALAAKIAEQKQGSAEQEKKMRSEIAGREKELSRLNKELETEQAARLEADIQVRVLEGKLEILLR